MWLGKFFSLKVFFLFCFKPSRREFFIESERVLEKMTFFATWKIKRSHLRRGFPPASYFRRDKPAR